MGDRYKGKLIVTDLDGTFFGGSGEIVQRNIDKLREYEAEGGLFTIATGRSENSILRIFEDYKDILNIPAILCNGTYIYDLNKRERSCARPIDRERISRVLDECRSSFPELKLIVYCAINGEDTVGERDYDMLKTVESGDWYKVIATGEVERVDALRAKVESLCGDCFEYNKAWQFCVEFMAGGVHKGTMLDTLREYLAAHGHDRLTVYAAGDYENDIKMLRHADVAVCPDNALDIVKQECKLVLCPNTEGVIADLIEHM